jgi:hypothetical protein
MEDYNYLDSLIIIPDSHKEIVPSCIICYQIPRKFYLIFKKECLHFSFCFKCIKQCIPKCPITGILFTINDIIIDRRSNQFLETLLHYNYIKYRSKNCKKCKRIYDNGKEYCPICYIKIIYNISDEASLSTYPYLWLKNMSLDEKYKNKEFVKFITEEQWIKNESLSKEIIIYLKKYINKSSPDPKSLLNVIKELSENNSNKGLSAEDAKEIWKECIKIENNYLYVHCIGWKIIDQWNLFKYAKDLNGSVWCYYSSFEECQMPFKGWPNNMVPIDYIKFLNNHLAIDFHKDPGFNLD